MKLRLVTALIGAMLVLLAWSAAAQAAGGVYVALGDSYTSAPLVLNQRG